MSGYTVFPSTRFKKDYKKFLKRKKEIEAIQATIRLLSQNGHDALPHRMKPHILVGNYKGGMGMPYFSRPIADMGTGRRPGQ